MKKAEDEKEKARMNAFNQAMQSNTTSAANVTKDTLAYLNQ